MVEEKLATIKKTAGKSKKTVGETVKGKRDHFVIGTKGYWLVED